MSERRARSALPATAACLKTALGGEEASGAGPEYIVWGRRSYYAPGS